MRHLIIGLLLLAPGEVLAQDRPNVILILTDDQGYGDLGSQGNPFIETPHLDQFYTESVRLTDFHVDPVCTPTRAALLTGRYSIRTGAWRTGAGRAFMRRDEVTLADVLAAAGYRTGMFGKWHLGDNYPYRPHDRGFQETVWHRHGAIGMSGDSWGNDYTDDIYQRNGEREQFTGYCTDVYFDEASKFMEANRGRPFFVFLSTNAPHNPYVVPDRYSAPYRSKGLSTPLANFMGMVTNIDENVGRLRTKLKEWDLEDNTILIFMTDNGALGGIRMENGDSDGFPLEPWNRFGANMRGRKGSPYEGGHRVPFFIRWPQGGLVGGKDVAGLTSRWRLVFGKELYDITRDPMQKADVAARYPQVVRELRKEHERWFSDVTRRISEPCRIVLGDPAENPVDLNLQDWHMAKGNAPWYQRPFGPYVYVSSTPAPYVNGKWMVEVAQSGHYEITLRQLPREADFAIRAVKARLKVGQVDKMRVVSNGATAVNFTVELDSGPQSIQTWFTEAGGKSRGAFYVEVRWMENPG